MRLDGAGEDFTVHGLRWFLDQLRGAAFRFVTFDATSPPAGREVLLRHDVDVDLDAAVAVAELEHELGVQATFFFLLTSDLYNLSSHAGRRALEAVRGFGHQIGLHFDASLVPRDDEPSLIEALYFEREHLASLVGEPITVFSLHKPADRTELVRTPAPDLISTYANPFFADITYVADSMGWWRYGHPFGHEFFAVGSPAQLVLHPVWWTSHVSEHPSARLEALLRQRERSAAASLADTIRPYRTWREPDTPSRWVWPSDLRGTSGDSANTTLR